MNYIDITIAATVGIGMIMGLRKGLVREVAGLVALIIGIVGARIFAPQIYPWIVENLGMTEQWGRVTSWAVCFFGLGWGVSFIARLLTRTLGMMALGGINKLLGAIFGGLKYILLFSVLFNLITLASEHVKVPGSEVLEQSMFYEPVKRIGAWSMTMLRNGAENFPPLQRLDDSAAKKRHDDSAPASKQDETTTV